MKDFTISRILVAAATLLAVVAPALAQTAPQTLNAYFKAQVKNDDLGFGPGILFRTDTVRTTGAAGGTVTKYFPSGKTYEEIPFANLRKSEVQGRQTRWFESGQVQATEEYAAGKREGNLLTFYPDGRARRREEYRNGSSTKSACFAADGQPMPCADYVVFPEYPGGIMALLTQVQSRTRYPKPLIRQGVQGKVLVDFIIDKTGAVTNARVKQSGAAPLDAEALRVVNSLTGWTPGQLDGEAVDVLFTLPVTFAIR
ncbi:protein TonB [Hymenobacter daecheongensis DSM 21074]|uniref:Protein TonB n=1 Tax=Hymenobacter daecheongensis DSM 21074 TaxID=1121955 RepID=A0A1M6K096_9BACT|nr:energy transducer TonB [Hymenobacter daecheongensis]SHJ52350.1 protein TonB [Hymenobacter daecheongensis DSM 21074]